MHWLYSYVYCEYTAHACMLVLAEAVIVWVSGFKQILLCHFIYIYPLLTADDDLPIVVSTVLVHATFGFVTFCFVVHVMFSVAFLFCLWLVYQVPQAANWPQRHRWKNCHRLLLGTCALKVSLTRLAVLRALAGPRMYVRTPALSLGTSVPRQKG